MVAGLSGKFNVVDSELPELHPPEGIPITEESFPEPDDAPSEEETTGLRTSSYTIYVDLPGNKDEMLLVHGYTGAYDRVSRRVSTYLRSLETRRPPKPLYGDWSPEPEIEGTVLEPTDEAREVLMRRGYLTEMSPAQEEAHFAKLAAEYHEKNLRQAPKYIFMPTYDCNLRCPYCFQDHMRTDDSFRRLLRTMSKATIDRIFGAMPQIEALHGVNGDGPTERQIGFFGGEPLLESSLPAVEHILDKALEMGPASFWAVTNATELQAYRHLLSPEKISSLQITLDGPPEEHDRRRIYADGSGSYETIARNLSMALDQGVQVSVRLNLDRNNIAELPALAEDMIARGWNRNRLFSVYTAAIRAENESTDASTTFNTWEMDRALVALTEEHPEMRVIGRPDDSIKAGARKIFHEQSVDGLRLRESFCSAHTGMYIFDAFADIYACWERTGDSRIRIGWLTEAGDLKLHAQNNQHWRSRTVGSNPACRKCRYALHCGGGCAVLALGKTGKYHANFCDGYASRFRASVAEAFLDHVRGEELQVAEAKVCDQ